MVARSKCEPLLCALLGRNTAFLDTPFVIYVEGAAFLALGRVSMELESQGWAMWATWNRWNRVASQGSVSTECHVPSRALGSSHGAGGSPGRRYAHHPTDSGDNSHTLSSGEWCSAQGHGERRGNVS